MRRSVLIVAALGLWLGVGLCARAQEDELRGLVAKAIKAQGGEKQVAALKAVQVKGKGKILAPMEAAFTIELFSQDPDKMKLVIDLTVMGMNFQVIQVYDGKKGWTSLGGMTKEMDAQELAEAREQANLERAAGLVALKGKEYKLSALGEAKVDGQDAVGIQVSRKDYRDVNLFFDKKSHMLVKTECRALDPNKQEVTQEKVLSGYKALDSGVKVPTKMIVNNDGKRFIEAEITETTIVDRHDDSVFAKP